RASAPRGDTACILHQNILPLFLQQSLFPIISPASTMTTDRLCGDLSACSLTPRTGLQSPGPSYTRRFFGGRQPLCGSGVTSSISAASLACIKEKMYLARYFLPPNSATSSSSSFKVLFFRSISIASQSNRFYGQKTVPKIHKQRQLAKRSLMSERVHFVRLEV
ncbi:hypothetical protein LCGC14_2104440, partial [marine sediment metagenome]